MTAQPPYGPQGPYEPQGSQQGQYGPQNPQFPQNPQNPQGQPYPQGPPQGQPHPQGQYGPQNPQGGFPQPGQQQPYPGAPGAVPQPGYVPPGGPPPGGAYPGPGHPGGPAGPAGGKGKRNLAIAGAAGVAVLLVAGIGIAVAASVPKVYVAFPDCGEAFPAEMFESALESEDVNLSGEFSEPLGDGESEEYGSLECSAEAGETEMYGAVFATALDPEGENLRERTEEILEFREDAEADLAPGDVGPLTYDGETMETAVWKPSSVGDTGFTVGFVESLAGTEMAFASSAFVVDNLAVAVHYSFSPGSGSGAEELPEAVALAEDLAVEAESRLSKVGETE